jgi:hypothetical protein
VDLEAGEVEGEGVGVEQEVEYLVLLHTLIQLSNSNTILLLY